MIALHLLRLVFRTDHRVEDTPQAQEMEASLSSAQQQVAAAQSEAETSKTNASSTSKRLQELEAILAEKDSVLHEVESKLSSAQSSSQDQEQRVSELNQKLKDFEQSKQQMAAELQVLQEARQQAAAAEPVVAEVAQAVNAAPPSEELTKQLQEKDSELSRVQAELAAKLAEITQLKDDVEAQSRKNNDSTQTIQQLESRIEELNKTVETGTALNVSSSEQLTMFKDKIAHFESQVTTLEQQLEEARKVGATTATTTAESEALTAEVQKLAEEKNRIQSELQIAQSKLSAMDSDLQTSNKELESQKSQLEASNARITEQEKQLVSLQDTLANNAQELKLTKESLESKTTELGVVSQQLCSAKEEANAHSEIPHKCTVDESVLNEKESIIRNLKERILELEESLNEKTTLENGTSSRDHSNKSSMTDDNETPVTKEHVNIEVLRLRERVADLEVEKRKLSSQHELHTANKVAEFESEICLLKEGDYGKREIVELKRCLVNREAEIASLTKQLVSRAAPNGDVNNQILALQQQLEITRKENEELKDKNLKAVDALSKVEKVSQVQVQEAKSDEDSKAAQAKLQAEVQHYKAILADTEGILNKLQSSVESEERKWHSKVRSYEDEVAQLRAELNRVKTTETEEKLKEMEERLSATESEKRSLASQLSQSNMSLDSLKWELEESRRSSTSDMSLSLQNGNGTDGELRTKLINTQKQLDREIQTNRQLMAKLPTKRHRPSLFRGCISGK